MDNAPKMSDTKEYIVANIVLACVIICAFVLGFASVFLFVLLPACLIYMLARFRKRLAIIPLLLVIFVPSLILMGIDVYTFILTVPTAVFAAYSIRRKRGLLHAVACGVCGWVLSFVLLYMIGAASSVGGVNQLDAMKSVFETSMATVMEAYQLSTDQSALIYDTLMSLLPAVLVCISAISAYGSIYIALLILKRKDKSYFGKYRPFCCIKADRMCVLVIAVCFLLGFATDGLVAKTLINILVVLVSFMAICGVSVISFFARRIKNKVLRGIVYVFMFLSVFIFSSLYIFIGFLDTFLNIRGLTEPDKR